jgi:hypothetical protein
MHAASVKSKTQMPQFTSLYGLALLLALIVCGLAYLLKPDQGREMARRVIPSTNGDRACDDQGEIPQI